MTAIEAHMDTCPGTMTPSAARTASTTTTTLANDGEKGTYTLVSTPSGGFPNPPTGGEGSGSSNVAVTLSPYSTPTHLGSLPRRQKEEKLFSTRVIYRTARGGGEERDCTVLQDCFVDKNGKLLQCCVICCSTVCCACFIVHAISLVCMTCMYTVARYTE